MASPRSPLRTVPESFTPETTAREGADLEAQSQAAQEPDHNVRSPVKDSFDIRNRRPRRSQTAQSYQPKIAGRQWKPGQEPGLDPYSDHPASVPIGLNEECQITVVDFSREDIDIRELDNESLEPFLKETKNPDLTCRWINVNGLSWDVISLLGREKKFHRLALEDLVSRRNRTKADWYSDHTYMVFPLQKLVHMFEEPYDDDNESANGWPQENSKGNQPGQDQKRHKKNLWRSIRRKLNPWPTQHYSTKPVQYSADTSEPMRKFSFDGTGQPLSVPPDLYKRTLQRYNSGPNEERTEYMEFHSALRSKGLAVSVEQVSIFLCADNTVVSFFEYSADDIETPIISRLASSETVLRRSNDASMVVQAILDAAVDLALPVTAAYKDAIDELELNVLTQPAIEHTRALYILISETSAFRANVHPIVNLVSALRDHKGEPMDIRGPKDAPNPVVVGVRISSLTSTYLSDVEDHTVLITEYCDQMRKAADNMISLIFNTINAYQSESMRQLTLVTILFLPLSFLTGYFGMNFTHFQGIQNSDAFYWQIASPLGFVVAIWLLRDMLQRWFVSTRQRRIIASRRKTREDLQDEWNRKADKRKTV